MQPVMQPGVKCDVKQICDIGILITHFCISKSDETNVANLLDSSEDGMKTNDNLHCAPQ